MIQLNKAKDGIRDDYRPKHTAVNAVNYKQNTANQIDDPDFIDIFKDKRKYNEKRSGIADI